MGIDQQFGPTLLGRILSHVKDPDRFRAAHNPKEGYCCALINLGPSFNRFHMVFCSFRAIDTVFCGQHDHFWPLLGSENIGDYMERHGAKLVWDGEQIVGYESPQGKSHVSPYDDEVT